MNNILYHYTSLEVLQKILETGDKKSIALWATQIKYLNDPKEYLIAIEELQKKLIIYDDSLPNASSKNLKEKLNDKKMRFFEWENIGDDFPYIISFTDQDDNLPMWNQYANNSKGVTIGFDKNKILEINTTYNLSLEKCTYDIAPLDDYLKNEIPQIHNSIIINSYSLGLFINYDSTFLKDFQKFIITLKHHSYNYENETRLVIKRNVSEESKFFLKNNIYKPYIEVEIPVNSIKEIILGPDTSLDMLKVPINRMLNKKGLKATLNNNNEDVLIKKSHCPFRNL